MKNNCLLIILLTITVSCNNKPNISYSENRDNDSTEESQQEILKRLLNAHFDPIEKQDSAFFDSVLYFFDSVVKNSTGIIQTDSAYHIYMESLRYDSSYEDFMEKLGKDKPIVDSFITKTEEYPMFSRYFRKDYMVKNPERTDTVAYEYNPNHYSSYMNLLKEAIKIDSSYVEYADLLWSFGSIPPSLVSGYNHYHTKLDFDNSVIRLITAIHYMCLISFTEL